MKDGFYTALGTPMDEFGNLQIKSYEKQIEDQINSKASGVLIMGSMGMQSYIKHSEYPKVAKIGVKAVKGLCKTLVGVMDNSVSRVLERIESISDLRIEGVVSTTPYYNVFSQKEIIEFFTIIAEKSPFPVYLYDLPNVTKISIQKETILNLMRIDNIKGIKTADINLSSFIIKNRPSNKEFHLIYSNLDSFDIANCSGIKKNLDGMFTCTPTITRSLYECFSNNNNAIASNLLYKIIDFRDYLIGQGIFIGYTYAMNILGYEGIFCPEFAFREDVSSKNCIQEYMLHNKLVL